MTKIGPKKLVNTAVKIAIAPLKKLYYVLLGLLVPTYLPDYQDLSLDFIATHSKPANIALHLVFYPVKLIGLASLLAGYEPLLILFVLWGAVLYYRGSWFSAVMGILSFLLAVYCIRYTGELAIGWKIALVYIGFFGQGLSHIVTREKPVLDRISGTSQMVGHQVYLPALTWQALFTRIKASS